jgi:hypothetical protein
LDVFCQHSCKRNKKIHLQDENVFVATFNPVAHQLLLEAMDLDSVMVIVHPGSSAGPVLANESQW